MIKVFISQPMDGKSDKEIQETREAVIKELEETFGEKVELIDSFIRDNPPKSSNIPIWYLGRSILLLSKANVAYFAKGWREARGCIIENKIANDYGICCIETN